MCPSLLFSHFPNTPWLRALTKRVPGRGIRWGNPTAAFWCCYGSAVESFSRLGADIYFVGLPKASNSSGSVSSPQSTQSKSSRSAGIDAQTRRSAVIQEIELHGISSDETALNKTEPSTRQLYR